MPIDVLQDCNMPFKEVIGLKQAHGTIIHKITSHAENLSGDGLWTEDKGIALYIKTADCVPLLFWNSSGTSIAAIHSGWRGTLENIAGKTCRLFNENGTPSDMIFVWIGPSICGKCYRFGEDSLRNFQISFPAFDFRGNSGCLDLPALITHQMINHGIKAQNIFHSGYCTFEEYGVFYSYRRDKGLKNRQYSIIGRFP